MGIRELLEEIERGLWEARKPTARDRANDRVKEGTDLQELRDLIEALEAFDSRGFLEGHGNRREHYSEGKKLRGVIKKARAAAERLWKGYAERNPIKYK